MGTTLGSVTSGHVQPTLTAAGVTRPWWQWDLGSVSLCPITGSEAGLRAMDEVPDKLVLIFQEPAENRLIYLQ